MASNAEYTDEYFQIIEELDGDIASRRTSQAYMQQSSAIVHHEVVDCSFVPRLYNQQSYLAFEHISTTMHRILCKVMERYLSDESYRLAFNYDKRLEELILLPRGYDALLPFARVDIFLNEEDYSAAFCEFNADGSSGMNEDREVVNSIITSSAFMRFKERHSVRSADLVDPWISEFLAIYATYTYRVDNPHIAICDYLENAVLDEFEIYRESFKKHGQDCSIYDVRDLRFDGEALRGGDGRVINAIWRRSVTNDIIDHWDESQALIAAVKAEKVALIGSFAGHIVHDKQIFRVLSDPQTKAFLSEDEIRFIEETVPFTAFLDGNHIDLAEIKRDRMNWIIKPTDHYGADQVYAGCYWSQEEWEGFIDRFANSSSGIPFIVQKYCVPYQTKTLPPDLGIENVPDSQVKSEGVWYNNLQGLYLFNGRFSGVFSRLGPKPTISKDMQGITSATIWVDF